MTAEEIKRGSGFTKSEQKLAFLAERTFLNLWSYPNTYNDKKQNGKGDGKELCDLLVVCGDDVIIFSDKSVEWPSHPDIDVAWGRWYRQAVKKSVDQIRGAQRWLKEFPDRVFLDPTCQKRLPIDLPPVEKRRVHGVVVAVGASDACKRYHKDQSGTFIIHSHLKGAEHTQKEHSYYLPFAIGDVDPDGPFVHVFDGTSVDLIMRELDTVSDFVRYLNRREYVIRNQKVLMSAGEEDLLGYYLTHTGPDGEHDFIRPDGNALGKNDALVIDSGTFTELSRNPQYREKKKSDSISYVWDRLIETFTEHILAGTSVSLFGETPTPSLAERGLRTMALENRLARRMLGGGVSSGLLRAKEQKLDRFARVLFPGYTPKHVDRAYVLLVLAYPKFLDDDGGYEAYRRARVNFLRAYCLAAAQQHKNIKTIVGIGIDAAPEVTGRAGGSEDLIAIDTSTWDEELEQEALEAREKLDVLSPGRIEAYRASSTEYPDIGFADVEGEKLSRQQRRARERAMRKAQRRTRGRS